MIEFDFKNKNKKISCCDFLYINEKTLTVKIIGYHLYIYDTRNPKQPKSIFVEHKETA
jgi:hypothetical protein